MDTINIIDPSYGDPTDGTGSLVSNQIKFKSESRQKIEGVARQFRQLSRKGVVEQVEKRMDDMSDREIAKASEVIADKATEATKELTDDIIATPVDDMNEDFTRTIKEKSDYAKRLEERKEALGARDADDYVDTLKPIKFENAKPLKIKAVHYKKTYDNGREFSHMTEVEEKASELQDDITADTIDQERTMEVNLEEIAAANEKKIAEEVNNAMAEATPEAEEIKVADSSESVTDIPEEELSIDYIRDEIDKIMNAKEEKDTKDIEFINIEEKPLEEEKEEFSEEEMEVADNSEIPEEELSIDHIRDEIDKIMNAKEEEDTKDVEFINLEEESVEEEKEEVPEEPIREIPEIVAEREAIIPIDINEEEKEEVIEPEEELQFDYSDVTEGDIANANSVSLLEEMKKAQEQKLKELNEADEKAETAERELVLSFDEVEAMRRQAVESEKSIQQKMEEFNKSLKIYDAKIEDANKRREKANEGKKKNKQEIDDYKASIKSNADLEKQLEEMMKQFEQKEKKDKKRR